ATQVAADGARQLMSAHRRAAPLRHLGALVPALALLTACPPARLLPGCGKDTDCKGVRICVRTQCVDPSPRKAQSNDAGAPAIVDGGTDLGPINDANAQLNDASAQLPAPLGASSMFHVDARHSGRSPFRAPATVPKETMHVPTGGVVISSPAIADDGTLFFGSHDKSIYAADRTGQIAWRKVTGDLVWASPALGPGGVVYVGS